MKINGEILNPLNDYHWLSMLIGKSNAAVSVLIKEMDNDKWVNLLNELAMYRKKEAIAKSKKQFEELRKGVKK